MRPWAIVVICSMLLGGCAGQQPLLWDAERIADWQAPTVRLNDPEGKQRATISRYRAQQIVEATRRIEPVAGITVKVAIAEGAEPNAFAWQAGGVNYIGFTVGMIDLLQDDGDAYAAIVGHEIAHLVLSHGAIRRQREGARTVASEMIGLVLSTAGVPMGGTIAGLGTTAVSNVFSRDEEREADKHGIEYARKAGFDPNGAVSAWEKMAARSGGFSIPFLSTHPMAQERLETMRTFAASSPSSVTVSDPPGLSPELPKVAFARLRPIGTVTPSASVPIPAGDLYLDMNSITVVSGPSTRRALWIVNESMGGGSSTKAHTLVNCGSGSLAVLRTTRMSLLNGEGREIEMQEHSPGAREPESSILEEAVRATCSH